MNTLSNKSIWQLPAQSAHRRFSNHTTATPEASMPRKEDQTRGKNQMLIHSKIIKCVCQTVRREGAVVLCGLDMRGLTTGTFHQGPEDLCLLCSLVGAVWRKQERGGGGVILKKAKSHRILLSLKKKTYIICSKSHFFIKFAKLWHFNHKILNHYHITF